MRKLPILAFTLLSFSVFAQNPIWVDAFGANSGGAAVTTDYCIDDSSNSYLMGNFTGSVTFGSKKLTASSQDVYIVKMNPKGKVVWALSLGGSNYEIGYKMAVDDSFNVYTTGVFLGTFVAGGKSYSNGGSYDGFLTKINSNGIVQWTAIATGTNVQYGKAVEVDAKGAVYWFGDYTGSSTIAGKSISAAGNGIDVFLCKLNRDGKAIRATAYGGNSTEQAYDIAVSGKIIYIAGQFASSNYKMGSTTLSTSGSYDVFLARLDTSFSLSWLIKGGGSSLESVQALSIGPDGSAYISGYYVSSFAMGGKSISGSWYDVYVARIAANSKAAYIQNLQGSSFGQDIISAGIQGFKDGSLYVGGYFNSSIKIGTTTYNSKGSTDAFVVSFNKNGAFSWINIGGNTNSETVMGFAVDSIGYYYLGGYYSTSTKFGSNSLSATGSYNNYIAKGTPPVNPPNYSGLKDRVVYFDSTFSRSYEVKPKTDANYKLLAAPSGMTIDPSTAVVTFTPTKSQLGKHKVVIYVENLGGFDKDSFTIEVIAPFKMELNLSGKACVNEKINFYAVNKNYGTLNIYWDFGDGTFSTLENVTKSYSTPGTYFIKAKAVNELDAKDSILDTIVVHPNPFVKISQVSACQNDSVRIANKTSIGSGTIVKYNWFKNDVYFSSTKNLSAYTTTIDTATYKLVSTSDNGCKDSANLQVIITKLPEAKFSTFNACADDEALFFDASTTVDDTIIAYTWLFGDGNKKKVSYPSMTHSYKTSGTYEPSLTVTTTNGCSNTFSLKLQVYDKPMLSFEASDFCFGNTLSLSDKTTTTGSILQRRWTTGDGKSYSTQNVTHNYKAPGKYSITLIVANSLGCTDTLVKKITVAAKAKAIIANSRACEGQNFNLQDSSTSGINDSWLPNKWYQDGKYLGSGNFVSTQSGTSPKTIKLIIETAVGCTDSIEKIISPLPIIKADFSLANGCEYDTLLINEAFDKNNLKDVKWFGFGIDIIDNDSVWYAVYKPNTEHKLYARTISKNGCQDSAIIADFSVYPTPSSLFSFEIDTPNKEISFFANYKSGTEYTWNFGNGEAPTIGSMSTISEKYLWNKAYLVSLSVSSDKGCSSTSDSLIILDLPNSIGQFDNSISVYPNPASNWLKIDGIDGLVEWKIYNATGKLLESGNSTNISISHFPKGSYFLEFNSNKQIVRLPFMKW